MAKIPHDPNEILAVVDKQDNVIGKATRKEVHMKGLLHREIWVYVMNGKRQVLLQKRSDNGLWDHSCGGHFPYDQTYEDAAVRELEEELGLKVTLNQLQYLGKELVMKDTSEKKNNKFGKIFLYKTEKLPSEFTIDKGEITEIRFFSHDEASEISKYPGEKITKTGALLIKKYILKLMT